MSEPEIYPETIGERLENVRERIAQAAERSGRHADDVRLIVVTKLHPIEAVQELFDAGHEVVGENRVTETVEKLAHFGGRGEWHFIGHLQRNKAAKIAGAVDLIHSVDSVRLIETLEKRMAANGGIQRILLELNLAGEANKTGAVPEDLPAMLAALAEAPHLHAEGLMTMAPRATEAEAARVHFARLREILESLRSIENFEAKHLSMGMSGDFEIAIEEGATLVRVGTGVMGARPK